MMIVELLSHLILVNVMAFRYNYIIVFVLSIIPLILAIAINKLEEIVKGIEKMTFKDFKFVGA